MSMKMANISPIAPIAVPEMGSTSEATGSGGISFKDVLGNAIQGVESARSSADQMVSKFLSGEGEDLHSTILASQRAELEFQMFLQVRNKVVSAYQEVMRMPM